MGISMSSLHIVSADENWQQAFVHGNLDCIFKLLTLNDFSVYFSTMENSVCSLLSLEETVKFFESWDKESVKQFLIQPVKAEGKLEINKLPKLQKPKYKIQIVLDDLGFLLDNQQYESFFAVFDSFTMYSRSKKVRFPTRM